jgi:hypothetical protein
MARRELKTDSGAYTDWMLKKATREIITVENPPNADGRVTSCWDRDESHVAAGHESGEVFIKSGERAQVARTPRVQEWLERGQLLEIEDEEPSRVTLGISGGVALT